MILEGVEFWHWWILAVVLVIAEIFAPGFVLIWLGVAAGLVGLALLLVPALAWEFQLLVFAVLSVGSLVGWRAWRRKHPEVSDRPTLNRRGERLRGRVLTLDEPIVNGSGYGRVDDTRWKVVGEDLPAGTKVKVVGLEGTSLKVERA